MKASVSEVSVRLRKPFVTAAGEIQDRELLLLRLEDDDGWVGWGEAAPLGVSVDEVRAQLEACLPILGASQRPFEACREVATLPMALAAVDLALWDLAGRRAGQPVWRLLGAQSAPEIEVNYTIAAPDRAGAAAEAAQAARQGFRCLKVKVGLGDDAGRIAAVRAAAGPQTAIRLDANGAWTASEALDFLGALEPADIELCEEPVHGVDQVAAVTEGTRVAISVDETAREPGALDRRLCDAVCLKIASFGGITPVIEAGRRARAAGYDVYLASLLDGPLGIAAALHAAVAIGPDQPCGLATLGMFERPDPLPPNEGTIDVPDGPGLGRDLRDWYGI